MKILYAATGDIAADLLQALYGKGLVKAVLTAPDAPGKRGKTLIPSPVKVAALELGLEVWQPETLRKEARAHVRSLMPDALMSFCYGKIAASIQRLCSFICCDTQSGQGERHNASGDCSWNR